MDVHSIYKITNIVNGKFYIGKAKDVDRRWKEHLRNVGKKRHPLYDGILHYGVENFKVEVLHANIPNSEIDALEVSIIVETQAIEKGYNLATGGEGGNTKAGWTPERLEEYRTSRKGCPRSGITLKMKKGQHVTNILSDEAAKQWKDNHKAAMRNHSIRRAAGILTPGEVKGLKKQKESHNTPEMKALKSKNALGKNNSQWCGYFQVYLPDGTLLKEYDTAAEAAKELKTTPHGLRVKARSGEPYERGKYKGYTFKFRKP